MSLLNGQVQLKKMPAGIKIEEKISASDYVHIELQEENWEMVEAKVSLQELIKKATKGDSNDKFALAMYYEWKSRKDLLELARDIGYEGSILTIYFHRQKFLEELAKTAQGGKVEFVYDEMSQNSAHKLHADIDNTIQEAVKWYTEAAELGHSDAQRRLQSYYSRLWRAHRKNESIKLMDEASIKLAIRGLIPAANNGYILAGYTLGHIYHSFGSADEQKAIKYFTLVAEQGIDKSLARIAAVMLAVIIFYRGESIADVQLALKWVDIAIAANKTAGWLVEFKDEISQKLTELIQSSSESQPVVSAPISSMTQHLMNKTEGGEVLSTETHKEDNAKTCAGTLLKPVCKP